MTSSDVDRILQEDGGIYTFDVDHPKWHYYTPADIPTKEAPTSAQCRDAGMHMFTFGIIVGYRISDLTKQKEVVLAMRFNKWEGLDEDTKHNITQLGKYFQRVTECHHQVTTNGPWKTSGKRTSHKCTGFIRI
jgi:hypothetical protein